VAQRHAGSGDGRFRFDDSGDAGNAARCPGGALTIVAHEDDDLIFVNLDVVADIRAGRCMRRVFLTAGEAGNPYPDRIYRENGPEAAYAQMAGVADNWTASVDDGLSSRTITVKTLVGRPNLSLQFLRLPDGYRHPLGAEPEQVVDWRDLDHDGC